MKLMERILVAVELTDSNAAARAAAVASAVSLANTYQAEVVLVHAIDRHGSGTSTEAIRRHVTELLAETETELTTAGVKVASSVVAEGRPSDVIVSTANIREVNLIVLGGQPKGNVARLFAGSTIENVLHRAKQPVWLAHPGETAPQLRRVLCALDYSPASDQAMRTAIHLARTANAKLTALHVVAAPLSYPGLIADGLASPALFQPQQQQFEQYLRHFDLEDLACEPVLVQGEPVSEIAKLAAEGDIDVLVLGAVGQRAGFKRMLTGSTTLKLLRQSQCSLLAIKLQDIFRIRHEGIDPARQTLAASDVVGEAEVGELAEYIEKHYQAGKELIANGFLEDAIVEFKLCIDRDEHFDAAYEGLAEAHRRLGQSQRAQHFVELAKHHRRLIWEQRVQAEIRYQHSLFSRHPETS